MISPKNSSIHVRFSPSNAHVKEALDLYVATHVDKSKKRKPVSMNDAIIYLLSKSLERELNRVMKFDPILDEGTIIKEGNRSR